MLKHLKKFLIFFIIFNSLFFVSVSAEPKEGEETTQAEEIEIVELTHEVEYKDVNALDLKIGSKTKFKTILKETFNIEEEDYIPEDGFYSIEYKEFDKELTSISLKLDENLIIEIYKLVETEIEDENGEKIINKEDETSNVELVKYILEERDNKKDLSTKNEELKNSIDKITIESGKYKKLTIAATIVCIILIIAIIGVIIGTNGVKTQNDELFAEIDLLETNVKELEEKNQTLNATIKKKDEQLITLKEKQEASNVYTNKLTQCVAKLNRDLENEKIKNQNTLENFTSLHEQDLTTIGTAHQKEIKTLKEDYESKIKELEDNNKALQKVISKYN